MSQSGWWLTLRPPEQVSTLVTALQATEHLDPCWWFAWNDLEMRLPGQLTQVSELDSDWEVLRIFSPQVELRLGPVGQQRGCWLLLEQDPQQALSQSFYQSWVIGEVDNFRVEASYHLLAGEQLKLPQGIQRGQVSYPRPLDYQFGSNMSDLDKIIVAEVRKYYDATNRLSTVRYAGLELREPGPNSLNVQPLPTPESALPIREEKR